MIIRILFSLLYSLSAILALAALWGLVLISQTGNVGILEKTNSIASYGSIVIIISACFCSRVSYRSFDMTLRRVLLLVALFFLPLMLSAYHFL